MDETKALQQIYAHVESGDVANAVMGCFRLAKNNKDYYNTTNFLRELFPNKQEFSRASYDETVQLKDDARKFLHTKAIERWLDVHALEFSLDREDPDKNVLLIGVTELQPELDQLERSIADMVVPANMHPHDIAAFTDQFSRNKSNLRLRIKAVQTIKARLLARCFEYATQIEMQLDRQRKNQGFLDLVQNDVNNFSKLDPTTFTPNFKKRRNLRHCRTPKAQRYC